MTPNGNAGAERVTAKQQTYVTKGTRDIHQLVTAMLDWNGCATTILSKGYQIVNMKVADLAAIMNIHCELMEQGASTLWQSRVRQGWEDGQGMILDTIQVPHHKIENLLKCQELINICKSAMHIIWRQISKMSPEKNKPSGSPVIEVSYVSHPAGKHKHEFVHADSVVQGDLMAIMPLVDVCVQPCFLPYAEMATSGQGPIARNDDDLPVITMINKINNRFQPLANTCDGAANLYRAMRPTDTVQKGDLLVYVGDALHALPAGDRKWPERFLYFKGRLAPSPKPEGVGVANGAHGAAKENERERGSAKATNKQAETAAPVASKQDGAKESATASVCTDAGSGAASQGGAKVGIIDPSGHGTEGDKKISATASVGAGPNVAGKGTPKEASGSQDVSSSATAASEHVGTAGSNAPAVGAASGVATQDAAEEAEDDPDSHGVVDALRLWKYSESEVLEGTAVHNLIAAGYNTAQEAARVYNKRYPKASVQQTDQFKVRFEDEYKRKKRKSFLLSTSKLPTSIQY